MKPTTSYNDIHPSTMRLLHDKVLVLPNPIKEKKTSSGIILPSTREAPEGALEGTVINVGPGNLDEPMELSPGDKIFYGQYAGTELSINGVDYLLMRECDVFLKYE